VFACIIYVCIGTYTFLRTRGGYDYRISWAHSSAAVAGGDLYADTPAYYHYDAHTIYVLVTYDVGTYNNIYYTNNI